MQSPTKDRLDGLKEERKERLYIEARDAAGFTEDSDYDTWLVLEELRTLTLSERAAGVEAATVAHAKPGLSAGAAAEAFRRRLENDPF